MSMSTTPTTARPLLQAVRAQFATRPTLRAVVAQLLEVLIAEQATPFNTAIESVYVAFPNNIGGYDVALLTDVVLDYLASGDVPDFGNNGSDRQAHLVDATKRRVFHTLLGETRWPDMLGLESLIRELPGILHIGFQETLSNYWNAPGTTGASRWQWLGDQLRDSLRSTALGADASIRQTLTQVVDYPDRLRLPLATGIHIYTLETRISQGPLAVNLLSPALLIACNRRVLHCRVSGEVRVYASMDDFALAWQQEMTRQFDADAIRLKRFEPDDNVFDTQAALLLNQQLEDLAAITLPARTSRIELEQLYAQVSDPAHGFLDAPTATLQSLQRVQTALPQWLRSAPVVDQLAYRKHSLELATVRQASKGKSWSDGIDSLRAFAAKKLHQQMLLDQPQAPGYKPDELELTFYVPVGGNTDIHTLSQKMTLTDLALSNLSGKPNGRMTIRHTGGQLIQDWTTPDYLEGLISRVDIGKTYPLWLKERLLTASRDALERQRLFGNELKVMLPLNALELAIKGECGFTRIGYQFIAALVQPTRVTQMLGEDEIVIRPLAFRRKADAEPDGVDNMFVIERADQRNGPHLLYRPLYAQSLHQFPNRDALLAAIAAPGEIQESVLAWLSDRARPIYAHGGFREPHIVHFSALDPFGQPDPPKPATLATDASADELLQSLHNGKLMQNLFGRNARTLVDLADRESVSNTESRWARLLNGGWLLFNTLLGLPLSSPVLLVGWMVSLASSLVQDIPALGSQDATTRELGLVDLLLNIALVLLHGTPSAEPAVEATAADRSGLALDPLRRVAGQPVSPTPRLDQGSIALPEEPPGSGQTLLDFARSVARDGTAAHLLGDLVKVRVAWPKEPISPIEIGPFKGIYRIADKWHASVAGMLFRVNIVPGFGEVFIIHPEKPDHPGIKLKTDGKGHWTLDRGLKLEGGGPKKRIQDRRAEINNSTAPLLARKAEVFSRLLDLVTAQREAVLDLRRKRTIFAERRDKLVIAWRELKASATPDENLTRTHQVARQIAQIAQTNLKTSLDLLLERIGEALPLREEFARIMHQIRALDNARIHEQAHIDHTVRYYKSLDTVSELLDDYRNDARVSTDGQTLEEVIEAANQGPAEEKAIAYQKFIQMETLRLERTNLLIDTLNRKESLLDDMAQISSAGIRECDKILRAVTIPEEYFAANQKLQLLVIRRELMVDRGEIISDPTEQYFTRILSGLPFAETLYAHVDIRSREGFTAQERISIYEHVIQMYSHQGYATEALQELGSRLLREQYWRPFLESLDEAIALAEWEMATAVHEIENTRVARPKAKPLQRKPTNKRVFKTRNNGVLIGNVRSQKSATGEALIDVVDPETGAVISTFHEHPEEGVFVQVVDAPPPARPPVAPSVKAAIMAANKLKQERVRREGVIRREVRQLDDPVLREEKHPEDWNTLLEQLATELEALIGELSSQSPVTEAASIAMEEWRAEVADLRATGKRYRDNGYKKQSPSAAKVLTLWRDKQLDFFLTKDRIPTDANDYLTEFAIKEKGLSHVLWYAHFHYARKTDADLAYVAGHLKRADQRNIGFKAQLQQASSNKEVARIWRSKISPEMAKKLFFVPT